MLFKVLYMTCNMILEEWKEIQELKRAVGKQTLTILQILYKCLIFHICDQVLLEEHQKTVSELPGCSITLILHVPNTFHRHGPKKKVHDTAQWEVIHSALLAAFSLSVCPRMLHILPDTILVAILIFWWVSEWFKENKTNKQTKKISGAFFLI